MQGEVSLQAKKKKELYSLASELYNYGIYIALILYTAQ
jgi:hypothetical protein